MLNKRNKTLGGLNINSGLPQDPATLFTSKVNNYLLGWGKETISKSGVPARL